ncbi:hypothetical protein KCW65_29690, partial [Mycobacterium tuberculosis]|nr:hypothetical protein [Mycobacterium tuberculosis]
AASPFAGLPRPDAFAAVALAEGGLGEPAETFDRLGEAGFAGLVLAGVGGGHVPEDLVPAVLRPAIHLRDEAYVTSAPTA